MAISLVKTLPQIVGTRNDAWMQVVINSTSVLRVKVIVAGSEIISMQMPPDVDSRVSFNLKKILQAVGVAPNLISADLPEFNQLSLSIATRCLKSFIVELAEYDKATGELLSLVNVSSRALLAGLSPEMAFTTSLLSYLTKGTGVPRRFLTNKPTRKVTSKETQEYLYFFGDINSFSAPEFEVKYQAFFTDGTASLVITRTSTPLYSEVGIFPAGYQQLDVDYVVTLGKVVAWYEVWLEAGGIVTDKQIYEIDTRCYPMGREFLFLNSLGGMDTIRIQEVSEVQARKESETVERFQGMEATLFDGQYYDFNVRTSREMKASTMVAPEGREWIRDLFGSERIYEITPTRFLPIRILSGSINITKGPAAFQQVEFSYRYQFDEFGYTKP